MYFFKDAKRANAFKTHFLIASTTTAFLALAWPLPLATAEEAQKPPTQQTAPLPPVDACTLLDSTLATQGKDAATAPADAKTADPAAAEKLARQRAIGQYAERPPLLLVKVGGDTLAGPGVATFAIEDKRIDPLTDTSKVCAKVYLQIEDEWKETRITQLFLSAATSDAPKRLNVTFEVKAPDNIRFWSPSKETKYLVIVALQDGKQPVLMNYWKDLKVTSRWLGFGLSLLLVVAAYLVMAWATFDWGGAGDLKKLGWISHALNPVRISAASYGEASMSQLQVLLFTLIVGGLLFHLWFTTLALSDISGDLLKLLGISALGAVGSRFTHTLKTSPNDQTIRYLIGKGWYNWPKVDERKLATFRQLLLTDGRLDVYKFQIGIFTLIVACYVLSAGQASLGEVKISETMLYLIGISQGVYVGGKAVTDRTTDLEAATQKMIELEPQIRQKAAPFAANAVRPDDLQALDEQYRKAAITAAQEFASLQHRRYPTPPAQDTPPGASDDINQIDPKFLKP